MSEIAFKKEDLRKELESRGFTGAQIPAYLRASVTPTGNLGERDAKELVALLPRAIVPADLAGIHIKETKAILDAFGNKTLKEIRNDAFFDEKLQKAMRSPGVNTLAILSAFGRLKGTKIVKFRSDKKSYIPPKETPDLEKKEVSLKEIIDYVIIKYKEDHPKVRFSRLAVDIIAKIINEIKESNPDIHMRINDVKENVAFYVRNSHQRSKKNFVKAWAVIRTYNSPGQRR